MDLTLPSYIKLKPSKRARRLALRLDAKERVFHLVKPSRVSLKTAQAFAEEHDKWARSKIRELPPGVPFKNGRTIPVLGYQRTININYDKSLKRTDIIMKRNEILINTNVSDPTDHLKRFFKEIAHEVLENMSYEKAALIRRRLDKVTTRDTKSRWGSCSYDRQISYSWRLIFAPYEAMDYVVAHEVAHLKHLDHSERFWDVCRDLSYDFEEGQYWMREHGHELMRYGTRR